MSLMDWLSRSLIGMTALLLVFLGSAALLNAQGPSKLLADARAQFADHRLDSAITLLHAVTTDKRADSSERAEAFMWLGAAMFYSGEDSSVGEAFREALRNYPLLAAAPFLAKVDSALADMWEREQTVALCGEALPAWGWPPGPPSTASPMNSEARVTQAPEIVSGPRLWYPDNLRRAFVQGRVLVRAIIDSSGKAERGSVRILSTTHRGFSKPVLDYTERAQFRVVASGNALARSCVIIPVDFKIRR